ncbi:DNA polymerase III subunit delta [Candidatus Profftia sp. (ex Adelges kitamiensis)]|uniref:DNA polymerase III subunit delta n=1 Tax=Candidatus Profftia sp. (ex Adelges kitamiensis) TaxID=2864218 RepID=UPI001CE36720|nr:DNA polymerase III subunit delta [Candidatus Profftia sp. (ex Adelges kitamiensis)]
MTRVYPEQLASLLRKKLHNCYFIIGNEPLLLKESFDLIRQEAYRYNFTEYFHFTLNANTDWENIFILSKSISLFANRKIISLTMPENEINTTLNIQLNKFITFLHSGILLIISSNKITKIQKNNLWYKIITKKSLMIICNTPDQYKLPIWVTYRAIHMNLQLDNAANKIICSYYEGNLIALSQILELLLLLYPDSNVTVSRVKEVVNNVTHFYPYHWIEAILSANIKRAWRILQQLSQEGVEPLILLRIMQREVLLLIKLKVKMTNTSLLQLCDTYKVWQSRRTLIIQALQRLDLQHLYQAIYLLSQIEIIIKQEYNWSIWRKLESLTMLLCGILLPESMLNAE